MKDIHLIKDKFPFNFNNRYCLDLIMDSDLDIIQRITDKYSYSKLCNNIKCNNIGLEYDDSTLIVLRDDLTGYISIIIEIEIINDDTLCINTNSDIFKDIKKNTKNQIVNSLIKIIKNGGIHYRNICTK